MNIANQGFPAFRADLNAALEALVSSNSGATAPATTFANMPWYDTANNIFKIRNEDNDAWISVFTLDQSTDVITAIGSVTLADVVSLTGTQTLTNKTLTSPAINGQTVDKITDTQGGVFAPSSAVMRNRIINGAMVIDQRNAGASIAYADGTFAVDRFRNTKSSSAVGTAQQSTTVPPNFKNSLAFTCTTGSSPTAAQYNLLWHSIEGFNTADLNWGTANAATVTLSFWVRSSLTGTFGGALLNDGYSRGYVFTYTVSAANTWEYKTVTIAGDTSGTWLTNNAVGIKISFDLGSGTDSEGTAGSWGGTVKYTVSGAQKVMATTSATFYITGVQLEKGTQATSFEYRQYQQELSLCLRYYWRNTALNNNAGLGGQGAFGSTNTLASVWTYPVAMRASPTATQSGTTIANGATSASTSSLTTSFYSNQSATVQFVGSSSPFVASQGGYIYAATAGGYVDFSAEL